MNNNLKKYLHFVREIPTQTFLRLRLRVRSKVVLVVKSKTFETSARLSYENRNFFEQSLSSQTLMKSEGNRTDRMCSIISQVSSSLFTLKINTNSSLQKKMKITCSSV